MPTLSNFIARLREYPEFTQIKDPRLKELAEEAVRVWAHREACRKETKTRRQGERRLARRASSILHELSQGSNRVPKLTDFIARAHEFPEFVQIEPEKLEKLLQEALEKKKRQRGVKAQKQHKQPKGGDAMDRAILSGFETNRRRH